MTFGVSAGRRLSGRLHGEFYWLPWTSTLKIRFDSGAVKAGAHGDPRLAETYLKALLSVAHATRGVASSGAAHRILAEAGFISASCPAFSQSGLISETMLVKSEVLELIARRSTLAVYASGALACPFWAAVSAMPHGRPAAAEGGGPRPTMRQQQFDIVEAIATRVRDAISLMRRLESQLG